MWLVVLRIFKNVTHINKLFHVKIKSYSVIRKTFIINKKNNLIAFIDIVIPNKTPNSYQFYRIVWITDCLWTILKTNFDRQILRLWICVLLTLFEDRTINSDSSLLTALWDKKIFEHLCATLYDIKKKMALHKFMVVIFVGYLFPVGGKLYVR